MNATLEAALAMAERGFYVCPVQPNAKPPFEMATCEAKYRSIAGGQTLATRNPDTIKRWFAVEPKINYGVVATGMVILDVDVKDGKDGLWDLLELGDLPATFAVQTPTGGVHYYFSGTEVRQKPLTKAIDIRSGKIGYVVGPGSIINDEPYTIVCDAPVATVPEHIYTRLLAALDPSDREQTPVCELDRPLDIENAVAWLKAEPPPVPGNRNNRAFALACRLKDFGLSAPSVHEVLQEHWNAPSDDPLPEAEIEACAENCFKSGRYAPGCASAEEEFGDVPGILQELIDKAAMEDIFGLIAPGRAAKDRPGRPWLVKGMLLKGAVTLLSAQPGARKSTLLVGVAVGMAAGTLKHLGYDYEADPLNVMLINNEDDEDEVDRRIEACCTLNGFDYEVVKTRILTHKPKNKMPFRAVARDCVVADAEGKRVVRKGLGPTAAMIKLAHKIITSDIQLVIADPLASTHDGTENDNGEMSRVFSFFNQLCAKRMLPMMLAHHSRKPGEASSEGYAGDPFSSRGASAIHGSVRLMLTLTTASQKDGFGLGLKGVEEHLSYCRLDSAKDSNSTLGKHTKWFLCEGVRVGNPDDGDTAPALRLFDHKSQAELLVDEMHKYLRGATGLFNPDGKMTMQDAVDTIASNIAITDEAALEALEAHFRTAQTRDGVTLRLDGKKKDARITTVLNCEKPG